MMNKTNRIPIRVLDNIFDTIYDSGCVPLIFIFVLFTFINSVTLILILSMFLILYISVSLVGGGFHTSTFILINKDGFIIEKYGKKNVLNFDEILDIRIVCHEMKSNTYFDIYFIFDLSEDVIIKKKYRKVSILKHRFKCANYYFNQLISNEHFPQKWKQKIDFHSSQCSQV